VLLLVIVVVVLFSVVAKLVRNEVELSNTVVLFVPLFVSNAVVIPVKVLNSVVRDTVVKSLT
jgi:hypothetical protein